MQEIEALKFHLMITRLDGVHPLRLNDWHFLDLWKSKQFVNKL